MDEFVKTVDPTFTRSDDDIIITYHEYQRPVIEKLVPEARFLDFSIRGMSLS